MFFNDLQQTTLSTANFQAVSTTANSYLSQTTQAACIGNLKFLYLKNVKFMFFSNSDITFVLKRAIGCNRQSQNREAKIK